MVRTGDHYQNRIEFLQGTLDLVILHTLQWGPQHGYGLAAAIRANSNELFQVETGSLYPALHRLARRGFIAARWQVSESQQRVRTYRLTAAGKKQLLRERTRWEQFSDTLASILNKTQEGGAP